MTDPQHQRRGRKIAMSKAELDDFLAGERTCRVATMSPLGPHVTPLWYVWDGSAIWLTSVVRSQRWTDLRADPRVAIVVDAGEQYDDLRGAELRGSVAIIGEVPRTSAIDERVAGAELLFARKYMSGNSMHHDGRHAWLRLVPEQIVSWDYRKIGRPPSFA